jgi:phage/plasmid-associated DNA primase
MDGVQTIRRKVNGCYNDSDSILSDFNKLKLIMMTEKVENDKDIKELKLQVEQVEHQLKPKQAELAEFKRKYGDRATIPDLQDTVKNLLADLKEKKAAYEKHYKELKKIHVKPFEDTVIRFLETSSSIDNIIKEAKQEFYCRDFNRRMNENATLFLFNNGVFDLDAMVFRDGRPDDYITLESSDPQINYKEFCLATDAVILEIEDFFKKVIVDTDKREFFLTLVASCLEGYNINNIFPILTGSGSNSKSLTMSLIEDCFGAKYSGKLNSAFLTQKRNKSNSASPEYYAIADCRIVSSEESDMSDELNTAIIKEITGNSKIATRTLFQSKMTTKIPQFTPFLICNDLPIVKALDGGTWRRIVVVSFDSKFVDDPADPQWTSLSNVFQIDRNLKGKMKEWKEPFMYWLIHKYYKIYKENSKNLAPPECVKAYTDKFKDENDKLQPFIESNIVSTGLKTDSLKIKELYQRVLSWHREHFMGEKEPPQLLVKKYFEQKFGNYDSRGWIGRKLVDL